MATSATSSGTVQTGSNGSSYITGIATGLNTQQLINAGYQQKLSPYNKLQDKIANNTNIISSYSSLQTQSQTLLKAIDKLQTTTKTTGATNAFYAKQVAYTASDTSTGSNIVTATATDGATAGTHKVVVSKLAQGLSVTSDQKSSATDALGYTGTFTIGEAGKSTSTISVSSTSTLTDIKNAINATTSTSGVKADLLQIAGGGYKLVISSNDTAKSFTATAASGDDVLQGLGITASDASFANISQVAQQAELTLDGTSILSDSNTLTNVLTGLTLNLQNAAPSTTVTITLSNNTDGVTSVLKDVVAAYNAIRSSLDSLQQINADGTVAAGAYLANDAITRRFEQVLQTAFSATYSGSSYYYGLGSIGLTFNADNQLEIDDDTLSAALKDHFSSVQGLFQTTNSVTGLADTVYSLLDNYSNTTTGQFKTQSDTLTSLDTDMQTRADDYKTAADNYKIYLINKYATLETKVSQSQLLISQIKAILAGTSNNNN